jgi:predicted ATP-grasp superfamily ATP-dependent carboligase
MKFTNVEDPQVTKPMIIAAVQDMGNVGSIVIDFINESKHALFSLFLISLTA